MNCLDRYRAGFKERIMDLVDYLETLVRVCVSVLCACVRPLERQTFSTKPQRVAPNLISQERIFCQRRNQSEWKRNTNSQQGSLNAGLTTLAELHQRSQRSLQKKIKNKKGWLIWAVFGLMCSLINSSSSVCGDETWRAAVK